MRSLPCLLILLNLGLLSACDDDPAPGGSLDSGTLDAGPGDPDASNDGLRDASGEGPDAGSDGGPDGGSGCLYPGDCPGGDCLEGECVYDPPARCEGGDPAPCAPGELCDDPALGGYCALPCELDGTCPRRPRPCVPRCPFGQVCSDEICVNACETDLDCPEAGECLNGVCAAYRGPALGAPAAPLGQPGQIYGGVGVAPLQIPVGVSMAGFGNRPGPRNPYAVELGGSDRVLERQDARAIVISDDEDLAIIIRAPLCFATDYLISRTAWHMRRLTVDAEHPEGVDYLDHLILGATHSHSQPARYWNLLTDLGFGTFGFGKFSVEITDRVALAMAEAALQAIESAQPARFGWAMLDGFDPDRRIHSNRRGEGPDFIDDRMFIWRLDDLEGRPLAAMVNLAIHGTHMESTWITGDVHGAIEHMTGQALAVGEDPIPVLFSNGGAGNVSPRGDDITDTRWAKLQVVGHRVAEIAAPAFAAIETRGDLDVELITRRVPVSYEILGYDAEAEEFRTRAQIHRYGSFQCMLQGRPRDEPPHEDGQLGCLLDIYRVTGFPVPQVMQTTLSALRLGDLIALTLPGEPTSELTLTLSEAMTADAAQAGQPVTTMVMGYAQDHMFYLLGADDWFHGGYEASTSLWGWRMGSYLLDQARALGGELLTDAREPLDRRVKPHWWGDLPDDAVPPTAGAELAGEIIEGPGDTVARGQGAALRWYGGHPGVDLPVVTLEVETPEGFAAAQHPEGRPLDDAGFESILRYDGDHARDHRWGFTLELPFELPLGTYRLAARGHAVPADDAEAVPYTVHSAPFTVSPAALRVEIAQRDEQWVAYVNYPDAPSTDEGGPFDDLEPTGSWWRHGADLPALSREGRRYSMILGGPVLGDLSLRQGPAGGDLGPSQAAAAEPATIQRRLVTARAPGGEITEALIDPWPAAALQLPEAPAGATRLEVSDAYGNIGAATYTR